MAYNPLNEVSSGDSVLAETQNRIKENFDDHEARLSSLEGGGGQALPCMLFKVNGGYWADLTLVGTINMNIRITGVYLIVENNGYTGTSEVALEFKRGAGSWTSICDTNPSVGYADGANAKSSNAVINSGNSHLLADDLLRAKVINTQSGATDFLLRVDYEVE